MNSRKTWTFRAALIATFALLTVACGGPGKAESPPDGRLSGDWEISLSLAPGALDVGADTATVRGMVAFLPNRAGARVPNFGGIPQQIGTHNLRLNQMIPELGSPTTTPTAAGISAGDSVRMVLDPEAGEPILLRGTWQGSEVDGQWTVHARAGIDRHGRFSLRRPTS